MKLLRISRMFVAWPLIVAMMTLSMPLGVAQAALIGTDQVIEKADVAADRAKVAAFLARHDVRDHLLSRGVDPDEAAARVAGLSDAEVARIADRIDELPAGQGALTIVVSAVVIVAFILFLTDLAGVTDVYPFVNSIRR